MDRTYIIVLLITLTIFGCKNRGEETLKGYITGWNMEGIISLSLEDGEINPIRLADSSKVIKYPALDFDKKIVYFYEEKSGTIVKSMMNDKKTSVALYKLPDSTTVFWLLLDKKKNNLFFMLCSTPPSCLPNKLIRMNIEKKEIEELFSGNFYPSQKPAWLNASELIMLALENGNSEKRKFDITTFNVEDRSNKILFRNSLDYAITSDKSKMIIFTMEGKYLVYEMQKMRLIKKLPEKLLPDNREYPSNFIFLDNDHIAYHKYIDPKKYLGIFAMNLNTNKSWRISKNIIWSMSYRKKKK